MSSPEPCNLIDVEDDTANAINENSDCSSNNISDNLHSSGDNVGIPCDPSQHRDFDSENTFDSGNDDAQVLETEGNWAELPSLAIENIYSFLSRTDQSRMSLVCSRWAKDFSSPALWKTMKFYLPEHDYFLEVYPEVKFARKYCYMFRHVEIICKTVRIHLIEVIWRQLCWFLQAMESSSQLISIKFIDMGKYFRRLDETLRKDLFRTIIRFLNSQNNLKTVAFQKSRFSKEEGSELLKAMFHSDSNTIQNLTLRGFVNETPFTEVRGEHVMNLSEVCHRIAKVQSLELDYTQIFEDIINSLHEKLTAGEYQPDKKKPNLSRLSIFCDGEKQSALRGILPETWGYLTKVFPDMKVKMDVTIHSDLNREMEKFLVKEIPLQTLSFSFEKPPASLSIDISVLFRHLCICKFQDHLDVLNVVWMPSIDDFGEPVLSFVQSCKKLRSVTLNVKCESSNIDRFYEVFAKSARTYQINYNWVNP